MTEEIAEKGTQENPFDNLQDAFDACSEDGTGTFWVYNPDATLEFFELDEDDYEYLSTNN